jgi:hypothetical protein
MVHVVCIKPNGFQSLLYHDYAIENLKAHELDVFLKNFEGYNLQVAWDFSHTFNNFRVKVGDV